MCCLVYHRNSFILNLRNMARWARLGVLQRVFNVNLPKDYQIVEHIIHPDYKPPSLYNDKALFRLERDVEFSEEVRPLCLNSNPSLTPTKQKLYYKNIRYIMKHLKYFGCSKFQNHECIKLGCGPLTHILPFITI